MPARVMVRTLLGLLLVPAMLAPRPGLAQSGDGPVVATVNGEPVRRAEVMAEMGALPAHYRELPLEKLYPVVLNRIIDGRLLLAEALRRGLDEESRVRRRIARMRDRLIQEELLDRHVRANVTEAAVRAGYQDYLTENPATRRVSARHILLETEAQAREVIALLEDGADFAELAKTHSIGPSAPRGGDLGSFGADDMLREITDAAFAIRPGTFGDVPVESPFGWHVIKVEDAKISAPLAFEDAREELTKALSQRVIAELVRGLRKAARVTRFDIDGGTVPEGMFDPPEGVDPPEADDRKAGPISAPPP